MRSPSAATIERSASSTASSVSVARRWSASHSGALRGARHGQRAHPGRRAAQRTDDVGGLLDRQVGTGAGMARGGDPRRMRGARGEEEEERLGRGSRAHEADRPLRQPVGGVATHEHRRSLVDRVEVAVDRHAGLVLLGQEPIPPGRDIRGSAEREPVEVLADETRPVAGPLQPGRERGGSVEDLAVVVVQDARVPGEQTGQQARPRGAAERCVRERVRELGPPRARSCELRAQPRHRRERARRLVVGQHDDHVRPIVGAPAVGGEHDGAPEPDQREEGRAGHPTAGRAGTHSFRTFQMCSAGNARAHSSGA